MDEETQTQTTPQNTEPTAPDTAAQDMIETNVCLFKEMLQPQ